jgi:hypothetical protein
MYAISSSQWFMSFVLGLAWTVLQTAAIGNANPTAKMHLLIISFTPGHFEVASARRISN